MLIIRLQRTGKKNQADFRIVLAEKTAPVNKKFNEILGSYNPRKKDFKVKTERLQYWLGQHVALSATVNNLFITKGVMQGTKVKAFSTPKKEAAPEAAPAKAEETPAEVAEATQEMEAAVSVGEPVVEAKPENTETSPAEAPANPDQPAA